MPGKAKDNKDTRNQTASSFFGAVWEAFNIPKCRRQVINIIKNLPIEEFLRQDPEPTGPKTDGCRAVCRDSKQQAPQDNKRAANKTIDSSF